MTCHETWEFSRCCQEIGGCYKCGATPFCRVISEEGICLECGADQEPDVSMEKLVRMDLRALKGIRGVNP